MSDELGKPSDWRDGIFDVSIEEGNRGEFTVSYQDKIIFDKQKCGDRFPNKGEITKLVKEV